MLSAAALAGRASSALPDSLRGAAAGCRVLGRAALGSFGLGASCRFSLGASLRDRDGGWLDLRGHVVI